MFPELLIFLLLLLGLWWIYRMWRTSLLSSSDNTGYRTTGVFSDQSDNENCQQSFLQKVPKVFTQPHLATGDGLSASQGTGGYNRAQSRSTTSSNYAAGTSHGSTVGAGGTAGTSANAGTPQGSTTGANSAAGTPANTGTPQGLMTGAGNAAGTTADVGTSQGSTTGTGSAAGTTANVGTPQGSTTGAGSSAGTTATAGTDAASSNKTDPLRAGSDRQQTLVSGNASPSSTSQGERIPSQNRFDDRSSTSSGVAPTVDGSSVGRGSPYGKRQADAAKSTPSTSGASASFASHPVNVGSPQVAVGATGESQDKGAAELQRQLDDTKAELERLKNENSERGKTSSQISINSVDNAGGANDHSAELVRQAELNRKLQFQLSQLEIERKANRALKLENDDLRQTAEQTRMLESRIRELETLDGSSGQSGGDTSTLSAADAAELRRLRAELDSQTQRNEKYLLQITDLQTKLRDGVPAQSAESGRVPTANAANNSYKLDGSGSNNINKGTSSRKPLFQRPLEQDDLKKVKGIGPVMEKTLNDLGVTSFKQLAEFTSDDIQMVSDALDVFPGRIERDEWVLQAGELYRKKYLAKG